MQTTINGNAEKMRSEYNSTLWKGRGLRQRRAATNTEGFRNWALLHAEWPTRKNRVQHRTGMRRRNNFPPPSTRPENNRIRAQSSSNALSNRRIMRFSSSEIPERPARASKVGHRVPRTHSRSRQNGRADTLCAPSRIPQAAPRHSARLRPGSHRLCVFAKRLCALQKLVAFIERKPRIRCLQRGIFQKCLVLLINLPRVFIV